ncbi:methyl-accepting chemotaxis protein [Azospirillum argentinense]|uniref:Methyl-accepting chemotaxis protein n=1 Tax=Azospirillum argentinense TaxID=2970906 RepID=A0A2K1FXU1_9PROT|nr:methyl-accepting chemotaxis protein [Azospirillum argentinense]KAA1053361.1 Methyl-accepting chemotaxis protein [Azospirillum argentinense]MBK3801257.1 HAMP domain-containing protein [Azospirillum argentinense]PNQ97318.1 methyl-accepting chemotaxis protein [Azospirillum argentinense]
MKLKVKHKLMLSFGVVCLLTGLLAAFQMMRFADGMKVMMGIATYDIQVSEAVREIEVTESNLRSYREAATHAAALAQIQGGVPDITQLRRRYHDGSAVMFEQINKLKRIAGERAEDGTTEDRRRIWGELVAQINSFDQHSRRMLEEANTLMERVAAGTEPEALARLTRVEEMRVAMASQLASLHSDISRLSEAGRQNIRNLYDDAVRSSILALIIVVALAVAIAILIGSSVTKRLGTAIGYVTQVGRGDLTKTVVVPGDDELAELGTHLNEMTGNLRSMAKTTRATAESMHAATAQIRASTQQQAASVAQQLAAVEETTATLSEITESGAQINRRAQDVAQNAQVAASNSETGLKAVEDTNQAMDAIREQAEAVAENIVILSERTQAIGEIILTVNDIAERCHLLALNAAIEAAAAGEHGRTFAVVASEIKSLADQSKEATAQVRSNLSEIQHGINASVMLTEEAVKRVGAGKRQTDATQSTIRDLAESVQESVLAFQQIVAGTNQQQIGLEQVIQALQNIREASSQTAAGTRQLEGAATNLNDLGQGLVEAVRNYRV